MPEAEQQTQDGSAVIAAALRRAAGDDVAYTAAQLGHEDATFTLRVYTHPAKHRQRLAGVELEQFERALEWARMGTIEPIVVPPAPATANPENEETRHLRRVS